MKHKPKPVAAVAVDTPRVAWWYWLCIPSMLALITFIAYYPSLHYNFQFDDVANITKHFNIRHYTFHDLFFSGSRWISYWINAIHYSIGKFDPFSYRAFNVGLHCANGCVLFFILMLGLHRRRRQDFFARNATTIATITALLFLMHPVQTQTVSYVIQGQLEGLAAFFILSMCLSLLCYAYAHTSLMRVVSLCALFFFAIFSCCTKEIAIISPALLLVLDWFFIAQGAWKSFKSRLWLHGSIATLVVGVYVYLLKPKFFSEIVALQRTAKNNVGNVITHDPTATITPWMFFISQFKVIVHYLWIFIWPFNISVEYDWKLSRDFFAADCITPFLFLLACAYGVIRLVRREASSIVAFCAVWFFVCLAPRSSIIPSPELLVDYKTYLASCGWLLLLASALVYGVMWIIQRYAQRASWFANHRVVQSAACTLLVLVLGWSTVQRNTVWRSGLDFWGNIIKNAPNKARAYNNYGVELSQNYKKYQEAIPYFMKAMQMDPHYSDPCNNLSVAYASSGETQRAIDALRTSLTINPYYPEGYNNLASLLIQEKEYDAAERMLRNALHLRPHYGKAYYNLGRVYFGRGETEKSWECFKDACIKYDLDDDLGFNAYAKMSAMLHKYDDAIIGFSKLLALNPRDCDAAFNLANCYFCTKNYEKAQQIYLQYVQYVPNDMRVWYNLGETLYCMGDLKQALACFERITAGTRKQFPGYHLRVAACHDRLGDPQTACRVLAEVLDDDYPTELKTTAQSIINQLRRKHCLTT